MVGGGLLGVILSFVGALLASSGLLRIPVLPLAGTLLVLAVADLVGIPAKHLSRARQVPLSWKHVLPAPMSASVYGLTLGIGVLSTVYFWSLYALLLSILAVGDVVIGVLAGMAFGAGRVLPVVASAFIDADPVMERWLQRAQQMPVLARLPSAIGTAATAAGLIGGIS